MAKRVLIVEDNFDNRAVYADILRFAGYEVLEASNGLAGLEAAVEHSPDLILMDLSMPRMDGWQAVAALKADVRTADIPVFALSAHVVLDRDFEKAERAGFARYLTKPIEPKEVLGAIRDQIGAPEG